MECNIETNPSLKHNFCLLPSTFKGAFSSTGIESGRGIKISQRLEKCIWIGWGGEFSSTPSLQINPTLAALSNLEEHQTVRISEVKNIPNVEKGQITPVHIGKYRRIVEQREYLDSQILNQIRVVYHGMKFPIFLPNLELVVVCLEVVGELEGEGVYIFDRNTQLEVINPEESKQKSNMGECNIGVLGKGRGEWAQWQIGLSPYLYKQLGLTTENPYITADIQGNTGFILNSDYEAYMKYLQHTEANNKSIHKNNLQKPEMQTKPNTQNTLFLSAIESKGISGNTIILGKHSALDIYYPYANQRISLKNIEILSGSTNNINIVVRRVKGNPKIFPKSFYLEDECMKEVLIRYIWWKEEIIINRKTHLEIPLRALRGEWKYMENIENIHSQKLEYYLNESKLREEWVFEIELILEKRSGERAEEGTYMYLRADMEVAAVAAFIQIKLPHNVYITNRDNPEIEYESWYRVCYAQIIDELGAYITQRLRLRLILSLNIQPSLSHPHSHPQPHFQYGGCVVEGSKHSGKYSMLKLTINRLLDNSHAPLIPIYINCAHISPKLTDPSALAKFRSFLHTKIEVFREEPSLRGVLVLLHAHVLLGDYSDQSVDPSFRGFVSNNLCLYINTLFADLGLGQRLLWICVTEDTKLLNSRLLEQNYFDYVATITLPSPEVRKIFIGDIHENIPQYNEETNYTELVNGSSQFTIKDFIILFNKTQNSIEEAMNTHTPLLLRETPLFKSSISFKDIGGMKEAKESLIELISLPNKYPRIFLKAPKALNSGALLYGPPGTGKTLLCSAISKELNIKTISIKGPELISKYIGSSESNIREVFKQAARAAPCIIFLDELESIVPKRGSGSTGVTDRIVNQFLCYMDGVETPQGVFILGATSRPDIIDSAILRPGRMDKFIYCGMEGVEGRLEVLEIIFKGIGGLDSNLHLDLDLGDIANITKGFTPADLNALVYDAYMNAINRQLPSLQPEEAKLHNHLKIIKEDIIMALNEFKPSLSPNDLLMYENIYQDFEKGRVPVAKQKVAFM